jgi:hypothetical protein
MPRLQMDTTLPTGLRLRRACAAVRAKNVAMGFYDATDDFLLTCDPQAQAIWGHIADAAAGLGSREERAKAAGQLRDALEGRSSIELGSMARHTDLWLQVVDAVALVVEDGVICSLVTCAKKNDVGACRCWNCGGPIPSRELK